MRDHYKCENTCSTCIFFEPEEMQCRKNPPTVVGSSDGFWFPVIGILFGSNESGWPSVGDDDWCGEYVPKKEET